MTRLFRLLLWLYPPGFRRRFHREMVDLLAARAHARRPAALWRYALGDLFRSLPLAWHDALRPPVRRPQRSERRPWERRHSLAAAVLGAVRDVGFAIRGFLRTPAFTALAVLILALGIGVNGTIFTVVHNVLLEPLPFDGADRAVYIVIRSDRFDVRMSPAYATLAAWRNQVASFEVLEGYQALQSSLIGGREPLMVSQLAVTPGFMSTFGIRPLLGRTLTPADAEPGAPRVVILSEGLWRQAFGADPDIVGRTVTLEDTAATVVGVRRGDSRLALTTGGPQLWTVLPERPAQGSDATVIGRLKPGVTVAQAQAELELIRIPETMGNPEEMRWRPEVLRPQAFLSSDLRTGLWVLFGAVGFVLLIACANVANMILARGIGRGQEIAVRTALGASRGRIVRLLLAESVVLCLLGGAVAVLLAHWGLRVIATMGPAGLGFLGLDNLRSVGLNGASLAFTVGTSLFTGLLTGVVSALRLSHVNIGDALRVGGRYGFGGADQRSLRQVLVSVEVALALTLLLGAGLMVKSFYRLQHVDPGFDPTNLGALRLRLPEQRYPDGEQQTAFFEELLRAIRNMPGVESAVLASGVPPRLSAYIRGPIVEGYEAAGRVPSMTSFVAVPPGYFDVVRTHIVRGRGFTAEDQHEAPAQLAVINEALARRYWGRDNAVGKRLRMAEDGEWLTVIRVAEDIKVFSLSDDPERMQVYYLQDLRSPSGTFAIRATTDFAALIPLLKQQVALLDPNLPVRQVVAVEDELADSIARERFTTALFTAFAALAIVLTVAGVYAVVSVAVTLRLRELGIRIALGAETRNIMGVVMRQGMRPVALGVVVGLAAAVGLQRTVQGLLFNTSGTDPVVWIAAVAALIVVGAAACYVPARRAMRLDPVETLRTE